MLWPARVAVCVPQGAMTSTAQSIPRPHLLKHFCVWGGEGEGRALPPLVMRLMRPLVTLPSGKPFESRSLLLSIMMILSASSLVCNVVASTGGQAGGIHHFLGTGSCSTKHYCARIIGVDRLPGSGGQCGPTNGPQCAECRAFTAANVSRSSLRSSLI